MADKKDIPVAKATVAVPKSVVKETAPKSGRLPLFEKDNYVWMGIGAVIIALGMFLMSGGKNPDPNQFDTKLVYSTTRITVAPVLIIIGFVVEVFAIFKRPKAAAV